MSSARPTPGPRLTWEVPHEDATLRVAVARNLAVLVWTDAPNEMQMRRYHQIAVDVSDRYQRRYALLNVVLRGTARFSEGVRTEAMAMTRDRRLSGLGVAHLVEAPGLGGVATRAFLATVALVARSARTPIKVFSEPLPAVAFLHERLAAGPETWTPELLRAAYDGVVGPRRGPP